MKGNIMQKRDTRKERTERTLEMLSDPDLDLTLKEVIRHSYHVVMYELTALKIQRARRALRKHADVLNVDIVVFSYRKHLKKF